MNNNLQSDPVDLAIAAFQQMNAPSQPPDALVLALLPAGSLPEPARPSVAWPRIPRRYLVAASIAAAAILAIGTTLFLWNVGPRQPPKGESAAVKPPPVNVTPTPGTERALVEGTPQRAAPPASATPSERASANMTLERAVANAQVIVVAKAVDAELAPPNRPGDISEYAIRYQVQRVLKGELHDETVVTRTPTSPEEFIGKEWILMLSPAFMAGTNLYARTSRATAETEAKIMSLLGNPGP
jgi:hypothetical protein